MWQVETHFLVIGAAQIDYGVPGGRSETFSVCLSEPIVETEAAEVPWQAALDRLLAQIAAQADQEPGAARRRRVALRVLVSEHWLALVGVPWSSALSREATTRGYVVDQLEAAGFEVSGGATLRCDDAAYGERRLAVAYPPELMEALGGAATRLGGRLDAVMPLGAAAWWSVRRTLPRAGALLAVIDHGVLTLLQGRARRVQAVFEITTGDDSLVGLRAAWQRLRLRDLSAAEVATLQVVDLVARTHPLNVGGEPIQVLSAGDPQAVPWPALALARRLERVRHALDPVVRRTAANASAWGAALAAGLAAIVMAQQGFQTHTAIRRAEQTLLARESIRTPATPVKPSREEVARTQAVASAVRALNLPIEALLAAVVPPRDIRAAVLGMTVETGQTEQGAGNGGSALKIHAEARTGIEMTRYVAYLNERPAVASAYLARHEVVESQPARPYRFAIEVAWRE